MTSRASRAGRAGLLAAAAAVFPAPAFAHHPTAGMMPVSVFEGLASGLAHPVIGLDHFAFIVAVGLAAAAIGRVVALPVAFVGGTLIGCAIHLASIGLPGAEIMIAATVVAGGLLVVTRTRIPQLALLALTGLGGIMHGWAYGEGIFGAEQGPLAAYLLGFVTVQLAIAIATALAARALLTNPAADQGMVRIAGAVVLGIGIAMLVGHVEAIALPGAVK